MLETNVDKFYLQWDQKLMYYKIEGGTSFVQFHDLTCYPESTYDLVQVPKEKLKK